MHTKPPLDDPLLALFQGKRAWVRVPSTLAVTVRGEGGPYVGRVLELSRGGIRLVLEDQQFYEADVDGFAFVVQRFPDGAEVHFTDAGLSRRVRIVRITLHDDRWLALGCELEPALTAGEAVTLGVAAQEAESPEATAPGLAWRAHRRRPVAVLLRLPARELAGPYAVAPLLAAGEHALDLHVRGEAGAVADALARDDLAGTVVLGRRRLWEGALRLVACRRADANGTGPRVRLRALTATPLGSQVHRALVRARRVTD